MLVVVKLIHGVCHLSRFEFVRNTTGLRYLLAMAMRREKETTMNTKAMSISFLSSVSRGDNDEETETENSQRVYSHARCEMNV